MSDVNKKVLDALNSAAKPLRPGDIAEQTGLATDVVSKAIQSLKKEGKVHSPVRCFWAVPKK